MKFNFDQQRAIDLALSGEHRALISGSAGTGKTEVAAHVIRQLAEYGPVLIVAQAHKAIRQLTGRLGVYVAPYRRGVDMRRGEIYRATLAAMSGVNRDTGRRDPAWEYLPDDCVIVVDEVSQLSEQMIDEIGESPCRVVGIGDDAQLGPIGDDTGKIPSFNSGWPVATLTECMRTSRRGLFDFCQSLRGGDLPSTDELIRRASHFGDGVTVSSGARLHRQLPALMARSRRGEVIAPVFRNADIEAWDDRLVVAAGLRGDPYEPGRIYVVDGVQPYASTGDLVMIDSRGDEVTHAVYGSIRVPIITLSILVLWSGRNHLVRAIGLKPDETWELWRARVKKAGGNVMDFDSRVLNLEPGYALTSHKLQGSGVDHVILPASRFTHRAVRLASPDTLRRALYVSASRARENLIVVADS